VDNCFSYQPESPFFPQKSTSGSSPLRNCRILLCNLDDFRLEISHFHLPTIISIVPCKLSISPRIIVVGSGYITTVIKGPSLRPHLGSSHRPKHHRPPSHVPPWLLLVVALDLIATGTVLIPSIGICPSYSGRCDCTRAASLFRFPSQPNCDKGATPLHT